MPVDLLWRKTFDTDRLPQEIARFLIFASPGLLSKVFICEGGPAWQRC